MLHRRRWLTGLLGLSTDQRHPYRRTTPLTPADVAEVEAEDVVQDDDEVDDLAA